MKKLLLLSILLIFAFSCEDESDDNPLPAYTIEGKWLWSPSENRTDANTMFEFLDGTKYTSYAICNPCTDADWNALDSSDRIPGTDTYTFDGGTLTIDGTPQAVTFECDGGKMSFGNYALWRLSSDCY